MSTALKSGEAVERLYQLLAPDPVLLPIPYGQKGPSGKAWPETVFLQTLDPEYRIKLNRADQKGGNIGVLLGHASHDVSVIDIDDDTEIARFLSLNPALEKSLRTKGAKGCAVWVRIKGAYPERRVSSKKSRPTEEGKSAAPVAEWRGGGGHQQVIYGKHPLRVSYRFIVEAAPVEISFGAIVWPPEWGMNFDAEPRPAEPETQAASFELDPARDKRLRAYLATVEIAVDGQAGSKPTFRVANFLVHQCGLSEEETLYYLRIYSQTRCKPPWSEKELRHKVEDATVAPHHGERGSFWKEPVKAPSRPTEHRRRTAASANAQAEPLPYEPGCEEYPPEPEKNPFDYEQRQADEDTAKQDKLKADFFTALLSFGEFQKLEIPKRKWIIENLIKEADTGFVFGQRGAGKTWLLDIILSQVTRGADIDETWKATAGQQHVVLVDGEMPYDDTEARLSGLEADPNFLHVLHHEVLFQRTGRVMNLTEANQQQIVTELCEKTGAKLLVLETLSSLFRGLKEKDNDDWDRINLWLLDLRRRHIAVILCTHAGWDGEHQRGGSRREDDAMWVIRVKEVTDREPDERGARFTTEFTKWRNVDSPPLLRQWSAKTQENGKVSFKVEELSFDEQVLAKIRAGLSTASEIAEELNVHKSRVSRASERLEKDKLIEKHGNGNRITYKPRGFMRNEQ